VRARRAEFGPEAAGSPPSAAIRAADVATSARLSGPLSSYRWRTVRHVVPSTEDDRCAEGADAALPGLRARSVHGRPGRGADRPECAQPAAAAGGGGDPGRDPRAGSRRLPLARPAWGRPRVGSRGVAPP